MAIIHQIRRKYATRSEEVIADLLYESCGTTEEKLQAVVKRKAAEIAIIMATMHGGDWRVHVEHDDGFVHITRRLQHTPKLGAKED